MSGNVLTVHEEEDGLVRIKVDSDGREAMSVVVDPRDHIRRVAEAAGLDVSFDDEPPTAADEATTVSEDATVAEEPTVTPAVSGDATVTEELPAEEPEA